MQLYCAEDYGVAPVQVGSSQLANTKNQNAMEATIDFLTVD